jgi:hypothetical protein
MKRLLYLSIAIVAMSCRGFDSSTSIEICLDSPKSEECFHDFFKKNEFEKDTEKIDYNSAYKITLPGYKTKLCGELMDKKYVNERLKYSLIKLAIFNHADCTCDFLTKVISPSDTSPINKAYNIVYQQQCIAK